MPLPKSQRISARGLPLVAPLGRAAPKRGVCLHDAQESACGALCLVYTEASLKRGRGELRRLQLHSPWGLQFNWILCGMPSP
jgi:hypothetical protein